jgi:hypothetical protein
MSTPSTPRHRLLRDSQVGVEVLVKAVNEPRYRHSIDIDDQVGVHGLPRHTVDRARE